MTKYMEIKEFVDSGFLFELNRRVLHPFGLALEVVQESDGSIMFGGVWDCREDPEGIIFAEGDFQEAVRKWNDYLIGQGVKILTSRLVRLGFIVQTHQLEPKTYEEAVEIASLKIKIYFRNDVDPAVVEQVAQAFNVEVTAGPEFGKPVVLNPAELPPEDLDLFPEDLFTVKVPKGKTEQLQEAVREVLTEWEAVRAQGWEPSPDWPLRKAMEALRATVKGG